jgi:hypothetical protein
LILFDPLGSKGKVSEVSVAKDYGIETAEDICYQELRRREEHNRQALVPISAGRVPRFARNDSLVRLRVRQKTLWVLECGAPAVAFHETSDSARANSCALARASDLAKG